MTRKTKGIIRKGLYAMKIMPIVNNTRRCVAKNINKLSQQINSNSILNFKI